MTQTTKFEARMEGANETITADSLEDAIEQAEEWARDGSWDTTEGTIWVHAYLIETPEDGEETAHRITVRIDPDEPACQDGADHDWQAPLDIVGGIKESPGVWGHGGGVTIQEVCLHCGCGKLTDTWAQDPETGEQGLESVRYESGKYSDQVQQRKMAEVREFVESHDDDDEMDEEDLVRIFRLAYGREPDDSDRETGLWSLICAAV